MSRPTTPPPMEFFTAAFEARKETPTPLAHLHFRKDDTYRDAIAGAGL